ncbi:MAG: pyridoxal phosphate-dependent aminotransferase [Spirochaetia bacterium]|nr:pyridoxal phosphate-dependent aminotransferase [Spirochaetia bacterium]
MAVSSQIIESMKNSSWIRKMFEAGAELAAKVGAENVFDFTLGNPNIEPPEEFRQKIIDYINAPGKGKFGYMANAGYADVREKVAAYVGGIENVKIPAGNVIMTCGAAGGMNSILKTILNPGDNVIVSAPFFAEYTAYVANHCGKLVAVPCKADLDLDVDGLEKAISGKTVAMIMNSPNNPSGRVYPAETVRKLAAMLRRKSAEIGHAIYLISDEPYKKIIFDGRTVPGTFAEYENAIICTSFSKDLSIPGQRIGYTVVNPKAEDVETLINGIVLCTRILGYVNAPAIMQKVVADMLGKSVDISFYEKKRDRICEILGKIGYEFVKPEGAFYLFPKAPDGDDLKAVEALRNENILVVPGRGFGCPGYFRIAFCVSDAVIEGSAAGFERAFKAMNK